MENHKGVDKNQDKWRTGLLNNSRVLFIFKRGSVNKVDLSND